MADKIQNLEQPAEQALLTSLPRLELSQPKPPAPLPPQNVAAIELLQSWLDNDERVEQDEEWEQLKRDLDQDRLSYRKLFP